MKLLLFGKTGQLGWELERCLASLVDIVAVDFPDINLADPNQVVNLVSQISPDGILNASAYTAVDKTEIDRDLAYAINATGPGVLAEQA